MKYIFHVVGLLLAVTASFCCRTLHSNNAVVQTAPGLKDYYKDYFPVGVAVSANALKTDEAALIIQQFNSITPENAMKMEAIHPAEQQYNWRDAD